MVLRLKSVKTAVKCIVKCVIIIGVMYVRNAVPRKRASLVIGVLEIDYALERSNNTPYCLKANTLTFFGTSSKSYGSRLAISYIGESGLHKN